MAGTSLLPVLIPALIALVGVALSALMGFLQWRRTQAITKQLEAEKLAHQRDLLAWEKEKLARSQESDRDRAAEAAKADRLRDLREVQRAELGKARASRREASTDAELADQYRRTLAEQLKSVQILDMSRPLDLEKVYVQLAVREQPGQFAREREVRQLAEGDPREHLVRLLPEQQSVFTAPPDEALRRHQRIVVLGDPGSGKTTMLRHLALREAQGGAEAPVYVELRKFVDSGAEDLLTYVVHVLAEDYRFDGATSFIEESFARGGAALLLDGLDEVLGGASAEAAAAEYDRIIEDIGRLAVRYPNLLIAVTCRRAGWRPALNSFATLEVVDFTWDHIGQFIDNWFRAQPERGRQLRQALSDNLRMQTLATNPLMLSLIAIVFERELELPERRAELYNRCAEVMLREWDSHRSIRRFSKFTTDRKRDLLQEVAWRFHLAGKRYFPQADLLDVIADYLPTIGIRAAENAAILDEITAQYGMLKEQAHGWYGFLHLTMQEYFAAVSAAARGTERIDHVVRHRHDPWWEEVLVLQAGLVPDATGLLRDVLGWGPKKRRTDDIFSSDLLLAAQCLVGTPRIEDTGLRAEIMASVEALILDGPSRFHRERAAAALVRIGTPESTSTARTMLFDTDLPQEVRAAVAQALCGLPGEQTRQDVERLLAGGPERHGNEVVKAVLDAVATARLLTEADLLVDLLVRVQDVETKGAVVKALASTGDRSAVPVLHREFRETSTKAGMSYPTVVLEAIAELDGGNCLALMFEVLDTSGGDPFNVAEHIVRNGGPAGARSIAERVETAAWSEDAYELVESLTHAGRDFVEGFADELLGNPSVDWTVKWAYVTVMESVGASRRTMRRLHARPDVGDRTMVALAAALVRQGDLELIPEIRRALIQRSVPLDVQVVGSHSSTIYLGAGWRWLCEALHSAGDTSMLPELLDLLRQSLTTAHAPGMESASSLVSALSAFESDALCQVLVGYVSKPRDLLDFLEHRRDVMTAATAPLVVRAMGDDLTVMRYPSKSAIAKRLGAVAQDEVTAKWLWSLVRHGNVDSCENAYKAIHAICRRGRFRLMPDGTVQPYQISS